eukprot:TRINITY_DN11144_c1_g5_i1.p2 TRINITY_DN11144_c1_g5~~TRINITY_DN11144_c1_g5_i1.p2  ORF type:complete len:261 (-),score=49.89 TRINITY_DN11144_c1_g5_i1:287-1069(-)
MRLPSALPLPRGDVAARGAHARAAAVVDDAARRDEVQQLQLRVAVVAHAQVHPVEGRRQVRQRHGGGLAAVVVQRQHGAAAAHLRLSLHCCWHCGDVVELAHERRHGHRAKRSGKDLRADRRHLRVAEPRLHEHGHARARPRDGALRQLRRRHGAARRVQAAVARAAGGVFMWRRSSICARRRRRSGRAVRRALRCVRCWWWRQRRKLAGRTAVALMRLAARAALLRQLCWRVLALLRFSASRALVLAARYSVLQLSTQR